MKKSGFTLVELIVAIGVISLLAAIIFPKFTTITQTAKAANVQSNLSAIRTSIEMFRIDYEKYPSYGSFESDLNLDGSISKKVEKYYSKSKFPSVPESLSGSGKIVESTNSIQEGYSNGGDSLFPVTGDLGGWLYRSEDGRFRAGLATNAYGQGISWHSF